MKDKFFRQTWAEIQLDHIEENIRLIRKFTPENVDFMAIVKADGYGHGAFEVAQCALNAGADILGVALLDEAIHLRKKGIDAPILVLGYCPPEYAHYASAYSISLTVFQKEWLEQIRSLSLDHPLKLHIKIDTGMARIGVQTINEFQELLIDIKQSEQFILEGIFTHFAKADSLDPSYYQQQLGRFFRFLEIVKEKPKWIHASNSAATLLYEEGLFNLTRSGITIYGLTPAMEIKDHLPVPLKQAFSLYTRIAHVKRVKKGDTISYGQTYTASTDEWIATLPIGYADGWVRALGQQTVLVNGMRAPIVGRICMDQCMIKLPQSMPIGTKVTLIGRDEDEEITVDEIAEQLNTINYEVICMISKRVPRIYRRGQQIEKIHNPLLLS